jgi:hypothetical protein
MQKPTACPRSDPLRTIERLFLPPLRHLCAQTRALGSDPLGATRLWCGGSTGGRPTVMTAEKLTVARQMYASREHTMDAIAKTVGVGRATLPSGPWIDPARRPSASRTPAPSTH